MMTITMPTIIRIRSGSSSAVRRVDRGLDLLVVGVGHLLEHRLELADALADLDHVRDQRRELAARAQGLRERSRPR